MSRMVLFASQAPGSRGVMWPSVAFSRGPGEFFSNLLDVRGWRRYNVAVDECSGQHLSTLRVGDFFVSYTTHRSNLRVSPHEHETAIAHLVLDGEYVESTRRETLRVRPRHTLIKRPGVRHWNRFGGVGSRTLRLEFNAETLGDGPIEWPRTTEGVSPPALEILGPRLLGEIARPDALSPLVVEGLCLEFVGLLLRTARGRLPEESLSKRLADSCAEILRGSFKHPNNFSDIARELGLGRSRLAQLFRQHFGCTMGEYVRGLRVEFVTSRLISGDGTLVEIAAEAGFADQSHLSRTFRKTVGLPPMAWLSAQRCKR